METHKTSINLNRFNEKKIAIVPIVDGWGSYESRKLYFYEKERPSEDGWYNVTLGSRVTINRKATPLEISKTLREKKSYRGYALGASIVPINFDNFARLGFDQTIPVHFMDGNAFDIQEVVIWEDGRVYYHRPAIRANRTVVQEVKEAFDKEQAISHVKNLTPELKYTFVILSLQREGIRQAAELEKFKLSELEKEKRIKEFQATFPGRLQKVIEDVGGKLIKFVPHRRGYMVEWETGGQTIKSYIDDDMKVITAGFCLSGEDRKHHLQSLILTAKMFQEDAPLYITRVA